MYTLNIKNRYHIMNDRLYENNIPIVERIDGAWSTMDWVLTKKAAVSYVQQSLRTYSGRYRLLRTVEPVLTKHEPQIILWL